MARRATWLGGGLFGVAVVAALSLYALGVEMVGDDPRERRVPPALDQESSTDA